MPYPMAVGKRTVPNEEGVDESCVKYGCYCAIPNGKGKRTAPVRKGSKSPVSNAVVPYPMAEGKGQSPERKGSKSPMLNAVVAVPFPMAEGKKDSPH